MTARKPLAVEEILLSASSGFVNPGSLCDCTGGDVQPTAGAKEEGITQAGWFRKDELRHEIVFPPMLMQYDWTDFGLPDWTVKWLRLAERSFDLLAARGNYASQVGNPSRSPTVFANETAQAWPL